MIDEDFRVWLIEVNTNPSLALNNKKMKHILPNMFKDIFKITLDVVFEEEYDQETKDRAWEDTNFDLLYSRYRNINKRSVDPREGMYPVKELDMRPQRNYNTGFRRNYNRKNVHLLSITKELPTPSDD